MKRVAVAVLLLALLGTAACGDPVVVTSEAENVSHAPRVPTWAKVAPEQIAEAKKHGLPVAFENDLGMRFVLIPAGTFLMGSPESEKGRNKDETLHRVVLTRPFYAQITEATNGQYRRWRSSHRSGDLDGDRRGITGLDEDAKPVSEVSWQDAKDFAAWVTSREGERQYDLPTEAMWEYACRAGTETPYWFGGTISTSQADVRRKMTWHGGPRPAGSFPPNPWGLHDTHGGLWEWCRDAYGPYPNQAVTDPFQPGESPQDDHVLRGGSWAIGTRYYRSANRLDEDREGDRKWRGYEAACTRGFRLISPLPEPRSGK